MGKKDRGEIEMERRDRDRKKEEETKMTWVSEEKDEIKNNKTENRVFRGCSHRQKRQKERLH